LDKGDWDAVIYDYIFAASEIKKFPNLQIVQFNLKTVEYSIMVPCNNEELLREINQKIIEIRNSPVYETLYKKYFSTNRENIAVSDIASCDGCHIVQPGETLGTIAQNKLGSGSRYMEIFNMNQDRLASPHLIYVGIKLRMPNN
jgi:nucleoid-associated protein YgaU